MMNLCDIATKVKKCKIVHDCKFDSLILVGKDYDRSKKTVTFLENEKYINSFLKDKIDGVICTEEIYNLLKGKYEGGICLCSTPKDTFFKFHNYLAQETDHYGNKWCSEINFNSKIHETAIIASQNVLIGQNVKICAHCVIMENTKIGNNVIIREGSIIGTPGFYYFGEGDEKTLVENAGWVVIEDNVEIHSNVSIEKGVFDTETRIGKNTKIDNLCLIGHDSIIGENCMLAAGSTLAGGIKMGNNSFLGVGVVIAPNVSIGNNSKASSGAVVTKNVPDEMHVSGNFAIEHNLFLKNLKESI